MVSREVAQFALDLRESQGVSRATFAAQAGLTEHEVRQLDDGTSVYTVVQLDALARCCGFTFRDLAQALWFVLLPEAVPSAMLTLITDAQGRQEEPEVSTELSMAEVCDDLQDWVQRVEGMLKALADATRDVRHILDLSDAELDSVRGVRCVEHALGGWLTLAEQLGDLGLAADNLCACTWSIDPASSDNLGNRRDANER